MRIIYLFKDEPGFTRKILIDMAYLSSRRKIRLPKYQFEEGLYLPVLKNGKTENYRLSRDLVIKEDEDYLYFRFPFKPHEVEQTAV